MNLSIILPNCRDKEMLHRIVKNSMDDDEITRLKITSRTAKDVLDKAIENAKYDDILLVNPKNVKIQTSNAHIDRFRDDEVIFTEMKDNAVSSISSVKFNRKYFRIGDNINIKNIYEYIVDLADNISNVPVQIKRELTSSKGRTVPTNKLPKILFICDVKGGAWGIKTQYLKKYLSDEFDIDMINIVETPQRINPKKYDLYFTYGYSFVDELMKNKVPRHKRITGVTAHRKNKLLKRPLSQVDYVHANSMLLKQQVEKLTRNKVFYVPNGVDADMFYKKNEYDLLDRDYINIGHVGKLSPMKCQKETIEPVIKKLKDRGNKINYFPHYNTGRDKIPHSNMPNIYQNLDLMIISSIEEGTPNSLLESAACGVPMIGNRIGNLPEFIHTNGYNGYIVNDRTNINEYVRIIEGLDKEHLIEMGKNARQTVENGGTGEILSENYRKMFRKALKV